MAVGDIITAARYNSLQNRINVIMGVGSGGVGYGQTLASSQKSIGSVVLLEDLAKLRLDMIRARQHQSGVDETSNYPIYSTTDTVSEAAFANLEQQIAIIENNRLALGVNQSSLGVAVTSQRTLNWNATIRHNVTVDFSTANNARYFFNSGGEIRTYATITNFRGLIGSDWNTLLTNMGIIKLAAYTTTRSGTGTGSSIGYYNLTNTPRLIFTKTASGGYLYAANDYSVFASCDVANNIAGLARYVYLSIYFNDDKGPRPNFDEPPGGTTTSFVQSLRATGSNVSVNAPIITTTLNLQ
jgi:hypothetical protein